MIIQNHRIKDVRFVESPNYDDRPDVDDISLIIIHNISLPPGEFGGPHIEQLFTNQLDAEEHDYFKEISHLRVSAHVLIRRDGELIQFVDFNKAAWHAGVSNYKSRETCNHFSIGIELEGTDDREFESIQYKVLAEMIPALIKSYPKLSIENIAGHSDVAPGRKTDPGPFFNWQKLEENMKENEE